MVQNTHPTPSAETLAQLMRIGIRPGGGTGLSAISHRLPVRGAANLPPTICTVDLAPNRKGMFLVTCRELPEVLTYGADEEEALEMAEISILGALGARQRRRASGFRR